MPTETSPTTLYVDETGNLGEGFLGLGIFEPFASLAENALASALKAAGVEASSDESLPPAGLSLHAVDDPWPLKERVVRMIPMVAPGMFEFVWIDNIGEGLARNIGWNRDQILNLMLALPCIAWQPTTIEVEARTTADGGQVQSIREENIEFLRAVLIDLVRQNPLAAITGSIWTPDDVEIRGRNKKQQTAGLQVVDYLCWLRRRAHVGQYEDPVTLKDIAKGGAVEVGGVPWIYMERYSVGEMPTSGS